MALGFRAAGAQVAITGRNPEKNALAIQALGNPKAVLSLDVRNEEAIARTVTQVVDHFGRLDILVNNAGDVRVQAVTELSREAWDEILETHLTGAFQCAKHAARAMIARGEGGKIINIGSMFSIFGPLRHASYAAAKTGMLGLRRALAVELAAHNIQVNAILPGWHDTAMTRRNLISSPRGEEIRRKTPAGRWGTPEDVVGTAVYLASADSDFVTWACIPVDGGYSVSECLLYA
jgi:2-deoxy-D-gluconate 3-dehydrogenase